MTSSTGAGPDHLCRPDWEIDRYFHPSRQAAEWTTFYQIGMYDEAEGRLKPLLASQQVDLPADSPEYRNLAAEGMRYGIAAYREAAKTIELGELDEGTSHHYLPADTYSAAPAELLDCLTDAFDDLDIPVL